MTIRDYFAAKALQAFISNDVWAKIIGLEAERRGIKPHVGVAEMAWEQADAMLAERAK